LSKRKLSAYLDFVEFLACMVSSGKAVQSQREPLPASAVELAAFHFPQVSAFCCVGEGTLIIFSTFTMSLSFSLPFKKKQIPALQFLHQ